MRRLRDALAPIARSGGGASSSSATRARAYSSIIAASRPWRVAADAGIATGGETIGLGIPGGFGSDARGFVAASARRGLPAWARTNDEERKRDDADARDVDIAGQAWGGHYRRHFRATSRAGMAVKIPRGLGSASKQKGGGSEKAKADGAADGFDAASGISRDAKSKRTDAANDVRALHAVNVAIKANTAIFACKVRVRSFVIRS
jgi:hypothetical protein